MKAVLLGSERGTTRNVELPRPRAGKGELLVEMKACGLCGTDVEKIRGEYTAAMPVIGHEAVGVVVEAGEGVPTYKVGDRVFPHHHVSCGHCFYCRSGDETMCPDYKTHNLYPGGFSELIRVPEWIVSRGGVLKLPESVGFDEGTLIEPLACCLRAIRKARVRRGESVLVVGAGPVGMMHALSLRLMGAKAMVSDISGSRLDFVRSSGAGVPLDARSKNFAQEVKRHTEGRGADLAIVASGSPKALAQAMESVRSGGTVCLFGVPTKGARLDYDLGRMYGAGIRLFSSYGASDEDTKAALLLITEHREIFASLVTHSFGLDSFGEALRTAEQGIGIKVIVVQSHKEKVMLKARRAGSRAHRR